MAELATKSDWLMLKSDLLVTEQKLQASIADLRHDFDTQALRLTVRLGAMIVVAIGALATILKLT